MWIGKTLIKIYPFSPISSFCESFKCSAFIGVCGSCYVTSGKERLKVKTIWNSKFNSFRLGNNDNSNNINKVFAFERTDLFWRKAYHLTSTLSNEKKIVRKEKSVIKVWLMGSLFDHINRMMIITDEYNLDEIT